MNVLDKWRTDLCLTYQWNIEKHLQNLLEIFYYNIADVLLKIAQVGQTDSPLSGKTLTESV